MMTPGVIICGKGGVATNGWLNELTVRQTHVGLEQTSKMYDDQHCGGAGRTGHPHCHLHARKFVASPAQLPYQVPENCVNACDLFQQRA
jgi:hypothetical protein